MKNNLSFYLSKVVVQTEFSLNIASDMFQIVRKTIRMRIMKLELFIHQNNFVPGRDQELRLCTTRNLAIHHCSSTLLRFCLAKFHSNSILSLLRIRPTLPNINQIFSGCKDEFKNYLYL